MKDRLYIPERNHELKILPEFYKAVKSGRKTFEIRKNDRDYQVGDGVSFVEWENGKPTGHMSGNYLITFITDYEQKDGYVVFSIKEEIL